ncbi:MAG TPA: hypothetical protein VFQ53_21395 [Kofleriaceae bacterium]|nr:hypothetical protein [Kofleriaceae bacterium]
MNRAIAIVVLLCAATACDEGTKTKAKEAVNKVDKAIDNFDAEDAKQHLASAKESLAKGLDAAEDCAWAARIADDVVKDALKDPVTELRRICSFEAPLGKATRAVVAAEKAKAEQPEAPSYTECSSDEWAAMKRTLDGSPFASEPRWTELKARWTKVCPGS